MNANTRHQASNKSKRFGVAAFGLLVLAAQACTVGAGEESVDSIDQGYGSCDSLRSWDGGNWQFQVAQGEVIQHNGNAYQATQNIGFPNAECEPGNAAGWCSGWFTALGACSASAPPSSGTTTTTTQSKIPAACYANQMIDVTCAALAVAMAEEIGELNPLRDLSISGDRVVLSNEGLSRCGGACDNVQAILDLQDNSVNSIIDETVFSATAYRTNLVAQWVEQQNYEIDLNTNHPEWLPGPHTLNLVGTSEAYCGTDYEFEVNWQCSGGDIAFEAESYASKRGGGSDNFNNNGSGAMVCGPDDGTAWTSNWGASAPKMSYDVNFPSAGTYYVWVRAKAAHGGNDSMHAGLDGQENSTADKITTVTMGSFVWTNSTMDGAPATINVGSAGNHSFDLYAREDGIEVDKIVLTQNANYTPGSSSSCVTDTSTIENRMKFFRPNNTVIDFQASNGSVSIDPTGDLNGDTSGSGSGSCTASCMKFSRQASNLVGDCCTCDGLSGSFVQGGNPRTVLCSTN